MYPSTPDKHKAGGGSYKEYSYKLFFIQRLFRLLEGGVTLPKKAEKDSEKVGKRKKDPLRGRGDIYRGFWVRVKKCCEVLRSVKCSCMAAQSVGNVPATNRNAVQPPIIFYQKCLVVSRKLHTFAPGIQSPQHSALSSSRYRHCKWCFCSHKNHLPRYSLMLARGRRCS